MSKVTPTIEINKEIISDHNINLLKRQFNNEDAYLKNMRNLWATRKGLMKIVEKRPNLRESIMPQLHTINDLIGSLLNLDLEHPIYG